MSKYDWLYYLVINGIVAPMTIKKFNVVGDKQTIPEGANLILSNHVTNSDFLFIEGKMKCNNSHIVIAENALRNKFAKWIMEKVCEPILHVKGSGSISTVKDIVKCLKANQNVMLFPEGNTTFDGRTACLDDSIGKLVKLANSNLILAKISGGYLSKPRWATKLRRGRMSIEFINHSAEELKQLSVPQITELINRELYVDTYEEQGKEKIIYKSNRRCVGIERALYMCPDCNKIGDIFAKGNTISCSCGYRATMDEYGYIKQDSGDVQSTKTITELINNQRQYIEGLIDQATDKILCSDIVSISKVENKIISQPSGKKKAERDIQYLGKYEITAYSDKIVYRNIYTGICDELDYSKISEVVIFKANTLTIFADINSKDNIYEIHGEFHFNALKYRDIFNKTH